MKTGLVGRILLGTALVAALIGGCSSVGVSPRESNEPSSRDSNFRPDDVGTIGLALALPPGVALGNLSYTVTGPSGYSQTANATFLNGPAFGTTIGGIPFGESHVISVSGQSLGSGATCGGSAAFAVESTGMTAVSIRVTCAEQPSTGNVGVTGRLNECPTINSVEASPSQVTTGNSLTLIGAGSDRDTGPLPLVYSWTATSGTLANASSRSPTFTCGLGGKATITLSVFDGDALCSSHQSVDVTCVDPVTVTPIQHVIVLLGENRSFDHTFATYVPRPGQTISNLLSKGIVNADGTPGPSFNLAAQATVGPQRAYYVGVGAASKTPYATLPPPTTNGAPVAARTASAPFITVGEAGAVESDLDPADLLLTTTGATGLSARTVDTRIADATSLLGGPFQLTGPSMPYDAYTGDLTHRFYQMWQEADCSVGSATSDNPSGCAKDLFPFVLTSFSAANSGAGNPMAFFNVSAGDAPFFKLLADTYSMSDNFHQSVMGGTGANHSMLAFGDVAAWTNGAGEPAVPPTNQIADPNPRVGTNNHYRVDGAFSNCSDPSQPGVGAIVGYLESLPYSPKPNCAPGTYYYLNNTNPAYAPNGSLAFGSVVPPLSMRSIGDSLSDKGISWRFYGGAYNRALEGHGGYCQICNPFQYETRFMADPTQRKTHIKDTTDMFSDIANGTLPAVSFAHPDGLTDGHPQSSKLDLFEAYVKNILTKLAANPGLQASTLVIVTFDEGGGYYDSGFIQPVDFFGDGPRIPMIAISKYTKGGSVYHSYADHVSILKFIERNWNLSAVTKRSRDNLPNPQVAASNPYVPTNSPAIDDLFEMFNFSPSP